VTLVTATPEAGRSPRCCGGSATGRRLIVSGAASSSGASSTAPPTAAPARPASATRELGPVLKAVPDARWPEVPVVALTSRRGPTRVALRSGRGGPRPRLCLESSEVCVGGLLHCQSEVHGLKQKVRSCSVCTRSPGASRSREGPACSSGHLPRRRPASQGEEGLVLLVRQERRMMRPSPTDTPDPGTGRAGPLPGRSRGHAALELPQERAPASPKQGARRLAPDAGLVQELDASSAVVVPR